MNYRLLAIDLDGTLFDSQGLIPKANREAIIRAREAALLIALCTGRGLCEVRYATQELGHEGPVILAGGALVTDPTTGKTLHRAGIEPQLALQLTHDLHRHKQAVLVLLDPEPQQHDYLVVGREFMNDNTAWWFDMIGADVKYADHPLAEDMHHALRVGIVAPMSLMPAIQQELVARYGQRIVVHHFLAVRRPNDEDIHVLEVFAEGVNKWTGLSWLADEHRIPHSQVAAIGDHINDVAMIRHAACGIAMGNAIDTIKQLARHTTKSNDECGVAFAIDQILSGKW
jgi:hypothetical protein